MKIKLLLYFSLILAFIFIFVNIFKEDTDSNLKQITQIEDKLTFRIVSLSSICSRTLCSAFFVTFLTPHVLKTR